MICPNLLNIPGVGDVTAGLISGETGDIERFHSVSALISFSGTYTIVFESGKYKAQHCIPSQKGTKYLHYATFQIASGIYLAA